MSLLVIIKSYTNYNYYRSHIFFISIIILAYTKKVSPMSLSYLNLMTLVPDTLVRVTNYAPGYRGELKTKSEVQSSCRGIFNVVIIR